MEKIVMVILTVLKRVFGDRKLYYVYIYTYIYVSICLCIYVSHILYRLQRIDEI